MTPWLLLAGFGAVTVWVWTRIAPLVHLARAEPGPRTRRLAVRRGLVAVGVWQWVVAAVLIGLGLTHDTGVNWAGVIGLSGMGALMIFGARHGLLSGT